MFNPFEEDIMFVQDEPTDRADLEFEIDEDELDEVAGGDAGTITYPPYL